MDFREWQEPAWPTDIVDAVWMHDGAPRGTDRIVPPDNCADLLFVFGDDGAVTHASVVGAMSRPLRVPGHPVRSLGVRFKPGWLPPLLGVPGDELRDQRVSLAEVLHASDRPFARLTPGNPLLTVAPVVERLLRRAVDGFGPPPLVREALQLMSDAGGSVRVADTCRRLGVTRQHLAREFSSAVGLGPKFVARVLRVETASRRANAGRSWTRVALEAGFSDQSHLVREFVALRGQVPGDSRRDSISSSKVRREALASGLT